MTALGTLAAGLPFLATLLVKGVLVLAAAEAASRLLRRHGAAARHLLWATGLATLLTLPLLSGLLPPLHLGLLDAPVRTPTPSGRPASATSVPPPSGAVPDIPPGAGQDGTASGAAAATRRPGLRWREPGLLLLLLWGLGSLILLARTAVGLRSGHRLVRRGRPLHDPDWARRARRIASRLSLRRVPELIRSPDVDIPMVWGLLRPRVLLPEDAVDWVPGRRDLVLTHELAHVRRADCLSQLVGQLSHALHWPNPLAWRALERMRSEREAACDEVVLASGASESEYARLLLDIARGAAADPLAGASVAMARPSQLEGRLLSILGGTGAPRRVPARVRLAVPLAMLALAAPLASLQPWAMAAPTTRVPPAAVASREYSPAVPSSSAEPPAAGLGGGDRPVTRAPGTLGEIDSTARSAASSVPQEGAGADVAARAVAAMVRALRDPDPETRAQAADALGMLESEAAVEPLLAALQDAEPEVRRRAAWALGMIESPDSVSALLARLEADASPELRAQIAWALGMIEEPAAVDGLVALLEDPAPSVRRQAAWALGMIESVEALEPLVATLADASPEVRTQAVWALGMIGDQRAAEPLLQVMESDTDESIRRAAMEAVSRVLD